MVTPFVFIFFFIQYFPENIRSNLETTLYGLKQCYIFMESQERQFEFLSFIIGKKLSKVDRILLLTPEIQ